MMVEKEKSLAKKSVAKSKRTPDDKLEITFRLPKDLAIDVKTKAVNLIKCFLGELKRPKESSLQL